MTAPAEFDAATAVSAFGDGRYGATVDPGWAAPLGPNGGYLCALIVRAVEAELDPAGHRRLRSLSCHFLRRPDDGPLEIAVDAVRTGRRLVFGRVSARQDGREVLTALAALAVPGLAEAATWAPPMPPVGPPPSGDADWLPWDDRMPPLLRRVRVAPRIGAGRPYAGAPIDPGVAPAAGGWIELTEPRGIDAAFVALCTDTWWPPALEVVADPAIAPTIDLTIHFRADLPPGGLPDQPVLGRFTTTAATGGLIEEDGVVFAADGTLLAQSRQLALFSPIG